MNRNCKLKIILKSQSEKVDIMKLHYCDFWRISVKTIIHYVFVCFSWIIISLPPVFNVLRCWSIISCIFWPSSRSLHVLLCNQPGSALDNQKEVINLVLVGRNQIVILVNPDSYWDSREWIGKYASLRCFSFSIRQE